MNRRGALRAVCGALGAPVLAGAAASALGMPRPVWAQPAVTTSPALSRFGPPHYPAGFPHFDYVNPAAPRGGTVVLSELGTFDTLNWVPLQGDLPTSLSVIHDALMTGSSDELSAAYGLIAESAAYPDDLSSVTFTLRPEARWQDGHPITAEDVVWTFAAIREHGRPFLRVFYDQITGVVAEGERRVRFDVATRNRMAPLLAAAGFTPLPRHWWQAPGRDIARGLLEPVLGSGAYRVAAVDPGRSITYERVADYWAAALPVAIGQNNFDRVRYDFYRDDDVLTEAFLGGAYDFHQEYRALSWATRYDVDAVHSGRIVRRSVPDHSPKGIQAYFLNTRRPVFQDRRVRQALGLLYDFETTRRQLLNGFYVRARSYYPNSEFAAAGLPDEDELAILAPYRDRLPPELFTAPFQPPESDGNGDIRPRLRQALDLLRAAGWEIRGGALTQAATGEPMRFEFLEVTHGIVRLTQPYVANLARIGIQASIRLVDAAQYQRRIDDFDFDVTTLALNAFVPPGVEQRSFWGSAAAGERGSGNFSGIRDEVVDALIEAIVATPDRTAEDHRHLVAVTRALDRVLLWGHYVVPQYYNDAFWIAYWDRFGMPETLPRYGTGFPASWWIDPARDAAIGRRR